MRNSKLYSVTTGVIDPRIPGSLEAAHFIMSLDGFVAAHPEYPKGMLWLFDSEFHAMSAKKAIQKEGGTVGTHICCFSFDEKTRTLTFAADYSGL